MKKHIVTTLILLSFIGCKTAKKEAISQKPNILFIMTDDHALAAISAYKGFLAEVAPTPNIDRIANDGMRFNNMF